MAAPALLLERWRSLWQRATVGPDRRLAAGGIACVGVVALHLGRLGTGSARLGALGLLLGVAAAASIAGWLARRRRHDLARVLEATVARTEPELGAATLRALRLTRAATETPALGSPGLAELHLERLLARASSGLVERLLARVSWQRTVVGLALAGACFAAVVTDPFRLVEGLDVMAARDERAPVALDWLGGRRVVATAPPYLGGRSLTIGPEGTASLPRGSTLRVAGTALRAGRQLVLTDGAREVPLLDDGRGALVAHWTVDADGELRIAARFGDVLVPEPVGVALHAVADLPPQVALAGAPKTIALLVQPDVELRYEATDDHGLREVVLVLRAGAREQRRTLSEPQAGSRTDRGGITLRRDDEFLEHSYLPVEVTVEARDDDGFVGSKWGRSRAIVIVPPRLAEREALRYEALAVARDRLTDLLAARLRARAARGAVGAAADGQLERAAIDDVAQVLGARFGGLGFGGAIRSLVAGQLERLERAAPAGVARRQDALETATESAVLAVDVALAAVGDRDSRAAAKKLAEVATEAATAIELGRQLAERERGDQRLAAALAVLGGGGEQLLRLGALGRDLGEIVDNGLRRIRRAWDTGDRFHARLAAEDLAARLRVPDPSFGSAGGSGVEAGGPPRVGDESASDAAREAEGIAQALEQLRQEHAAEIASVERALEQAQSELSPESNRDELRQHAEAVRQAVAELPRPGAEAPSARAASGAGRAHAEAMAGALEQGKLAEAVRSAQHARDALEAAKQLGRDAPPTSQEAELGRKAADADRRLADELRWAEQSLQQLGELASERAAQQLERSGAREAQLAERARRIRRASEEGEAPLPNAQLERLGQAADAMQAAGRELGQHRGAPGLGTQRQAQRLLEMAQPEGEQPSPRDRGDEGEDGRMAQDTPVPGEHRDPRADAFRRRVTEGLRGTVPPHLRDALRRYAEGLLR